MLRLRINGEERELDGVDPSTPLLWILRDHLGMTGTRYGCGRGLCGTCTVHLNGQPVRACVLPASSASGGEITTIEGLEGGTADALRQAWRDQAVPQCGYCQTGQLMSAHALLERQPAPSDNEVDDAMSGCICRCGTYARIRAAVSQASESLQEEG